MKKIAFFLFAVMILSSSVKATGVSIIFCSKAYWSGVNKDCLDREREICIHIGAVLAPNQIPGIISYNNGMVLTIPIEEKEKLQNNGFLKDGQFYLEGEATFEAAILKQLGLPLTYRVSPGIFKIEIKDNKIIVTFK